MTDKKIESLKRRKEIQAEIEAHKKLKLKLQKEYLKRKKELAKIENELTNLRTEYEQKNNYNNSQSKKRRKGYINSFTRKTIPYILAIGSMYACFSSSSATPVAVDKVSTNMKYMKNIDSSGKCTITEQEEDFKYKPNIIKYQGPWHYNEETKEYEREVKNYRVSFLNKFLIEDIVEENKIDSLEKIFGEPVIKSIQRTNKVDEKELLAGATIEAIIFGKDKTQVVMVDESIGRNAFTTVLFIALCIFFRYIIDNTLMENDELKKMLEKVSEKYPYLDLTSLENEIIEKEHRSCVLSKKRVM